MTTRPTRPTAARIAGAIALCLALSAPAVAAEPYVPLDMTAAMGPPAPTPPKQGKLGPPCRLHIAGITDTRPDPTMGYMGRGVVMASDAPGWIRSGLVTLRGDARWSLVDRPEDADMVLEVEILKSYIFPVTTSKSASVVLRIRYSHSGGPLGENIYRGARDSVNWAGTKEETAGLLNRALLAAVDLTKADLVKGCAAARAPKPA